MTMKTLLATALGAFLLAAGPAGAADYVIATKGAHASINFKFKHLGFSWLAGRFDEFSGSFSFDPANPEASKISVEIVAESVNSNHAKRDKHIRSADFLETDKYPKASFVSTSMKKTGERTGVITGNLTLRGITKEIAIQAEYIGGGDDPWGGFRQGFAGTTSFKMADFGIPKDLGPASRVVEMELHVEGIRQ